MKFAVVLYSLTVNPVTATLPESLFTMVPMAWAFAMVMGLAAGAIGLDGFEIVILRSSLGSIKASPTTFICTERISLLIPVKVKDPDAAVTV